MMLRLTRSIKIFITLLTFLEIGNAQKEISGPLIVGYGDTYTVDDSEYTPDFGEGMKIVFDITAMGSSPEEVSAQVNTIARCVNMHANAGVKQSSMDIYAVFHSNGTYTILDDDSYYERYRSVNPHTGLLNRLDELGVKLYVCGQSLSAREVDRSELNDHIKIALSAMTVFTDLQMKGYALIKF